MFIKLLFFSSNGRRENQSKPRHPGFRHFVFPVAQHAGGEDTGATPRLERRGRVPVGAQARHIAPAGTPQHN